MRWDDRYERIRQINRGGIGRVLLVQDRQDGKRYALKILLEKYLECPLLWFSLQHEYEVQKLLSSHPNIPRVFDFGIAGTEPHCGCPYFTMEHIDSSVSLLTALHRVRRPLDLLGKVMPPILRALGHMHEQGYLHLDLKAQNVLVQIKDEGITPYLIDFGTSLRITNETRSPGINTPEFAAPELLTDNDVVDQRTDLYSIGLMIYEIMMKRRPWTSSDEQDLLYARTIGRYPNLKRSYPDALHELVYSLLRPKPEDRPRTAKEVFDILVFALGLQEEERWYTIH